MRRLFILLTVCTLILAGCSGQNEQPITESQSVETTSKVEETGSTEIEETEDTDIVETESTEKSISTEAEESKEEPEPTTESEQSKPEEIPPSQEEKPEPEPPVTTETSTPAPTEPEQLTEAPAEVVAVAYDPYEVVSLATAKTKVCGKISIPEDLDNMLANGEITKEEYDAYYPYDGAGYYSVFVETDLNEASTTSGRKLESVEGIADYISGMLALETGPYFYIEYTGITNTGGKDYYEFRCYRA